jgi:hypothetical protein
MKKHIAIIAGTVIFALVASPGFAQLQRVEIEPPEAPGQPEPPEAVALAQVHDVLTGVLSPAVTAGRALIVPREAADPKEFADIEEDLNVMARILEKAATGRTSKERQAMGIWVHGGFSGSASPKNLFIEGHGALFFLNVNYPLLPPATRVADTETKDKTSTEWEEARRELYRPQGGGFEPFEFHLKNVPGFPGQAETYDAGKVEDLKRDLVAALKNASHIRNLKPDETITVVVSGRSPAGEVRAAKKVVTGGGGGGGGSSRAPVWTAKVANAETPGTRLILRARKADVDAFQKDKLDSEEFRKKVSVIVY